MKTREITASTDARRRRRSTVQCNVGLRGAAAAAAAPTVGPLPALSRHRHRFNAIYRRRGVAPAVSTSGSGSA